MTLPRLARSLPVLFLASQAAAQSSFVERSAEVGLLHQALSGLDTADNPGVTPKKSRDWLNVGLALEDIDGDNDPDVVACGALLANTVFRNDGNTFVDITAQAGINEGEFDRCAAMADYDLDGDLDLFIGAARGSGSGALPGRSRLYRNDGNGSYEDVTVLSGTYGNGRTLHAYWHDLDLDGLPDLYTSEFNLTANCWYRNNGDGTFTELANELGIDDAGNTHVAAIFDSDADGLLDLFVANDYLVASALEYPVQVNPGNRYYHGLPDGTFENMTQQAGLGFNKGVMGFAVGDVNYDGQLDVYMSNIQNNILAVNQGAPGSGVQWTSEQDAYAVQNDKVPFPDDPGEDGAAVGWGTNFRNFDFDQWQDLLVVNGHVAATNAHQAHMPKPQPNALFTGTGPEASFVFEDRTEEFGLYHFNDERGCAVGDVDADGDIDILIASVAGPLLYHENQLDRTGGGLIIVEAETGTSVPQGIGTLFRWIDPEGIVHIRNLGVDAPTASHGERLVTFGTGPYPRADIEVTFLSGMQKVYPNVPADTRLVVEEPEMIRLSTRTMPILAFGQEPTSVTVTAFAHSQTGVPLDGTASVLITAPGLTPVGPVTHVSGNEFQRVFSTNNLPGDYRVAVQFDGWNVAVRPTVHVHGVPNANVSAVVASPEAVRANSTDTFEIAVAPKDANGVGMTGLAIAIDVPGATPTGALVDHGDGRYSRTFAAPATPGLYPATVTANGFALPSTPVEVGGAADIDMSELEIEVPFPAQAASPDQLKILFTPRDAAGRRLGPKADLRMVVQMSASSATSGAAPTPAGGSRSLSPSGGLLLSLDSLLQQPDQAKVLKPKGHGSRRDGSFLFIVEKPAGNKGVFPSGKLAFHEGSTLIGKLPFDYKVPLF